MGKNRRTDFFSLAEDVKFKAPLSDVQERYGDYVVAFENLRWLLIEFKRSAADIKSEKDKFFATNTKKYSKHKRLKSEIEKNFEIIAYNFLMDKFSKRSESLENRMDSFVESHVIISIDEELKLKACTYWGQWWKEKEGNGLIPISITEIIHHARFINEFAIYAGMLMAAKGGTFTVSKSSGGSVGIDDLKMVVGVHEKNEVKVISTMEKVLMDYAAVQAMGVALQAQNNNDEAKQTNYPKPPI